MIPIYGTTEAAAKAHPNADVFINYASFRSAAPSAMKGLHKFCLIGDCMFKCSIALDIPSIRTVVIIAEGVPISDGRRLIAKANKAMIMTSGEMI